LIMLSELPVNVSLLFADEVLAHDLCIL
jgi:hypothetical protein